MAVDLLVFFMGSILQSDTKVYIKERTRIVEMKNKTLIPWEKEINDRAKALLPLMWEMPEETLKNLVSFYIGIIARIPDDSVAKELWNMLLNKLKEQEKGQREQQILVLCLDQVQSSHMLVRRSMINI